MGRQQYLERLVYGRSAFEELRPEDLEEFLARQGNDHDGHIQQYDAKGRPTNARSEEFEKDLRHAQNEVLALVGAIERRNKAETDSAEAKATARRDARKAFEETLENEHACGERLLMWTDRWTFLALWAADVLLARVLLRLHPPEAGFWQTLTTELTLAHPTAWAAIAMRYVMGLLIVHMHQPLHELVMHVMTPFIKRHSYGYRDPDLKMPDHPYIRAFGKALIPVVSTATDMVLMPVSAYGCAMLLGLTPTDFRSPLPSLQTTAQYAIFTYGNTYTSIIQLVSSPVIPFLCLQLFRRYASIMPRYMFQAHVTDGPYRKTYFAAYPRSVIDMANPLKRILGIRTTAEVKALHWVGWRPLTWLPAQVGRSRNLARQLNVHPRSSHASEADERTSSHRITQLALLPVTFFGQQLCRTTDKLLMLPLEALFLQRSAKMYINSGLPLSAAGVAFAAWQSRSGPFGWTGYLSAVGLALATRVIVQGAAFGVVWAIVRWQGVRNFGWTALADEEAVASTDEQLVIADE